MLKTNANLAVLILAVMISLPGCSGPLNSLDYETVQHAPNRNPVKAQREHDLALKLLEERQFEEAEKALKKALAADITFGIAHNNLGKVYYHQSKFYLAAWEFQYAIKLMPNHPEPRNNLGLVFEAVGQLDKAVTVYGQALDLQPDNPQFIGNLARARVRRGDRDESLRTLLSDLIMRDTRPEWVMWAHNKLALFGDHDKDGPKPTPPGGDGDRPQ